MQLHLPERTLSSQGGQSLFLIFAGALVWQGNDQYRNSTIQIRTD